MHRSGYVNIIGRPNVGKSTLMNALVGERMSIITNKPQTTRHRIIGILSAPDYQIIFSDTPGIIKNPGYKMQRAMNNFVEGTFEDADVMLFVTEITETYEKDDPIIEKLNNVDCPKILVINKKDISKPEELEKIKKFWTTLVNFTEVIEISALNKINTEYLLGQIVNFLPEGPEYYPSDQLTDRPERFFVSEIIREKILLIYHQEIPYSCEVIIEEFKDSTDKNGDPMARIRASVVCSRKTQKPILIGKGGESIKQLGIESRKDIEIFLNRKAYLELNVKVREDWRNDDNQLKYFGYH